MRPDQMNNRITEISMVLFVVVVMGIGLFWMTVQAISKLTSRVTVIERLVKKAGHAP